MDIQQIKERIWQLEYYGSGLNKLNAVEVRVVNLRVRKDRAVADVIVRYLEDGVEMRYSNVEYPLDKLFS